MLVDDRRALGEALAVSVVITGTLLWRRTHSLAAVVVGLGTLIVYDVERIALIDATGRSGGTRPRAGHGLACCGGCQPEEHAQLPVGLGQPDGLCRHVRPGPAGHWSTSESRSSVSTTLCALCTQMPISALR